jgi:hypothetical protein
MDTDMDSSQSESKSLMTSDVTTIIHLNPNPSLFTRHDDPTIHHQSSSIIINQPSPTTHHSERIFDLWQNEDATKQAIIISSIGLLSSF